ncbi:MAG: hypothetical protein J2P21_04125 [Chloracidobacterium sp.]|nr:hypothetical protein [Chloracidobacterium sp.]
MKTQIRNAITSLAITAFAGFGLMALGQDPTCPAPQPVVIQQTVEQTCTQPQVVQTVQDFVVQPQTTTTCCADMCELTRSLRSNAGDLRKYFRRSARNLDCIDDSFYDNVREFDRATRRLRREYRRDCQHCDVTQEVQEVLNLAHCISAYMDPCSLCPEAIEAWQSLQCDLQTLAGNYCTTASFQQPVSLACPVPVCAQPTCAQPAIATPLGPPVQIVQPVQPAPVVAPVCPTVQPAPVVAPACPGDGGPVIFK